MSPSRVRYALANVLAGVALALLILNPARPLWHILAPLAASVAVLFGPRLVRR